jgi:hypothetical protein
MRQDREQDQGEDGGCAYPLEGEHGTPLLCGKPRRPGSSFCADHHAISRLPHGSREERRELVLEEMLARAVGGRLGREACEPPEALLRRLDRITRLFLCSNSSRYVHGGDMPKRSMVNPTVNRFEKREAAAADLGPTPERLRHGPVEPLARPIADSAGRPSRPWKAIDTLAIMEGRGSITAGMRQAGEDFRTRFAVAQLDPLRAHDPSHIRIAELGPRLAEQAPGPRIEAARRQIWGALQAVGGVASPAGSCLWHVLGWEQTLREWAQGQGWNGRRIKPEAAAGILIAALGALESHLGGREFLR